MTLAEQFRNGLLHVRDSVCGCGLDDKRAKGSAAGQTFHRAGVGDQDDIVLIVAHTADALGRKRTYDSERSALDPDDLPDRITIAEQCEGGCFADEANLIGVANIHVGKLSAGSESPGAN